MTLSGLDSDLLNEARGQQYQDRIVRILVGIRDTLTGVMVSAPEEIFYGYMDQMVIVSGRETAAISLRAESEQARWRRLATRFYDDVTLQSTYSGDLFFKYLPDMTHLQLKWGMDNPGVTIGNSNESSFWKTG